MKSRVLVVILLLLLVGVGVFFLFWEGSIYGGDYSEIQRKAWNERLEKKGYHLLELFFDESQDEFEKDIRERQEKQGPEWCLTWQERGDISRLPMDALTEEELMVRAETEEDDDACLEIARRMHKFEDFWLDQKFYCEKSIHFLSEHRRLMVEKWLQEVVDRKKRPGSEFLLSLFQKECLSNWDGKFSSQDIEAHKILKDALSEGEFRVYVLLKTIEIKRGRSIEEVKSLDSIWERKFSPKVKEGDSIAVSQFAEWKIFLDTEEFQTQVVKEMQMPRHPFILWLSTRLEGIIQIEKECGTSVTQNYAEGYLDSLREKALQGDVDAMYKWMSQTSVLEKSYGRKQWEDIFLFSRQLLEMGHAGYFNNLSGKWPVSTPNRIILSFYSQESIKRNVQELESRLLKRGHLDTLITVIQRRKEWKPEEREQNLELLSEIFRIDPGLMTVPEHWMPVMSSSDQESKSYLMARLTELGNEKPNVFVRAALDEIARWREGGERRELEPPASGVMVD